MKAPLNMPPGSVRAILALSVILAVVVLAVMRAPIPETLTALAGGVVAYYFKARQDETAATSSKGAPDVQ